MGEDGRKHHDVRKLFSDADVNKDGKLDYHEFCAVLNRFGYVDDGNLEKLMRRFDFDDSGFIDYHEFMRYFAPQLYSSEQHNEMDRRSTMLAVSSGIAVHKRPRQVVRKTRGLVEGLADAQKPEDMIKRSTSRQGQGLERQNSEELENLESRMMKRIEGRRKNLKLELNDIFLNRLDSTDHISVKIYYVNYNILRFSKGLSNLVFNF